MSDTAIISKPLMHDSPNGNTTERIGRLETLVESIHEEQADIRNTLKSIQNTLARSRETNWSVILSGIMVVGAIYAAAIHPLAQDISRSDRNLESLAQTTTKKAETLAEAVLVKGVELQKLQTEVAKLAIEQAIDVANLKEVHDNGSPIKDRRLTLIEYQLAHQGKP